MCVDFADLGTGFGINREPLFRLLIAIPGKLIIKTEMKMDAYCHESTEQNVPKTIRHYFDASRKNVLRTLYIQ